MDYQNIDTLKFKVWRLSHLLKRPEPGLKVWQQAVQSEVDAIAQYASSAAVKAALAAPKPE